MAFVAIKPCRFAGQSFKVGEIVPADVMQPGASKNLVKMGIIAEKGGPNEKPQIKQVKLPTPEVVIHMENMELRPTQEGLQAIFNVLTSNVVEAETIINEMTDNDALILLHTSDSRKSVKELAEARATAISAPAE